MEKSLHFKSVGSIKLPHGNLEYDFVMTPSRHTLLQGENGVGKSSFYRYLKVEQGLGELKEISCFFFDQFALRPLGDLAFGHYFELVKSIKKYRFLYSHSKDNPWVKAMGLEHIIDRPFRKLSGGQNQALRLLMLTFLDVDLYVIDEASNNLDRDKTRAYLEWLNQVKKNGKFILLTDHRPEIYRPLGAQQTLKMIQKDDQILIEEHR